LKRYALIALAALMLVQQASADVWQKSVAAAQKKAKEKNQLIFVDLFADWCGWCHKMEQEVFVSQTFQSATDDMILLRLNTEDGADGTRFAQQFQVTSLPTFLMLTPDLAVAGVIRGYAPANEFVKSMNDMETKYDAFQKKVKVEATFAKDYDKRLDLAREFSQRRAYNEGELRLKRLTTEKGVPVTVRDQAFYELALVQWYEKKYDESIRTIRKLDSLAKSGEALERSRILAGQVYVTQGNLKAAAEEYRSFKKSFPASQFNRNVDMILPEIERQLATKK
jgi:thioredoxin-related protein